jgi:pseudouridine kinase
LVAKSKRIVCLGGATLDRRYYAARPLIPGTSNPVESHRAFGGVARNVAENLARLGVAVGLVTILGDDEAGAALLRHLRALGVDVSGAVTTREKPTAEYVAVIGPKGELVLGLADMDIFALLTTAHLERASPQFARASFVLADCNLPAELLADLVRRRQSADFKLALDAVSAPKAQRLPRSLKGIDLLFLNKDEADAYLESKASTPAEAALALRARGACAVVLTLGRSGAVIASEEGLAHSPALEARTVDVTGAGDAMIAGTLYAVQSGEPIAGAVRMGALLAAITTENGASVHPELTQAFLAAGFDRIAERLPSGAWSGEAGEGPRQGNASRRGNGSS